MLSSFSLSFCFYFLRVVILLKEFTRSCSHILNNMLCTSSLVVQFSKINRCRKPHSPSGFAPCQVVPFWDSLYIIPLSFRFVKGFFKSFSKFFFEAPFFFRPTPPNIPSGGIFCRPLFERSIIISLSGSFVKGFSKIFLKKFLEAFPFIGRNGI